MQSSTVLVFRLRSIRPVKPVYLLVISERFFLLSERMARFSWIFFVSSRPSLVKSYGFRPHFTCFPFFWIIPEETSTFMASYTRRLMFLSFSIPQSSRISSSLTSLQLVLPFQQIRSLTLMDSYRRPFCLGKLRKVSRESMALDIESYSQLHTVLNELSSTCKFESSQLILRPLRSYGLASQ